jgi:hypothetical protein
MFENLDIEGKYILYLYLEMSTLLISLFLLGKLGFLNQLTLSFVCIFYLALFFNGYNTLQLNLQKQEKLKENQSLNIQ